MPDFSNEILDHVISFIDDPRDLVSPCLTSKLFAALVQPHIQYRVIRCTLATTELWKCLSKNVALAQNVRSIEIQRQYCHLGFLGRSVRPPIVPKQYVKLAYDKENRKTYSYLSSKDVPRLREAEWLLIRAIKNMINLRSFTWDREPPMYNSIFDEDVDEDIWTALRTGCPALAYLHVMDASDRAEFGVEDHDETNELGSSHVSEGTGPEEPESNQEELDIDPETIVGDLEGPNDGPIMSVGTDEENLYGHSDPALNLAPPEAHPPFDPYYMHVNWETFVRQLSSGVRVWPVHHSALWMLTQQLKSFSYHTYAYRNITRAIPVDELTALLRRCRNLEFLSLHFTLYPVESTSDERDISTADLDNLLADISWPNLHTLRTGSVHVSPSTAAEFFKRHPTIVTLDILENTDSARFIKDGTDPWLELEPTLTLHPGSLPNITRLFAPRYISHAIYTAQIPGLHGGSSGFDSWLKERRDNARSTIYEPI